MPARATAEAHSDTLSETQPGCHGLTSRGPSQTFWLLAQVSNLGNYNNLWENSPSIPVGQGNEHCHHFLFLLLAKTDLCRGNTLCSSWWLETSQETIWSVKHAITG